MQYLGYRNTLTKLTLNILNVYSVLYVFFESVFSITFNLSLKVFYSSTIKCQGMVLYEKCSVITKFSLSRCMIKVIQTVKPLRLDKKILKKSVTCPAVT